MKLRWLQRTPTNRHEDYTAVLQENIGEDEWRDIPVVSAETGREIEGVVGLVSCRIVQKTSIFEED